MSDDQIKLTGDLEVVFENPPNDENWEEFQKNGETWYRYTWKQKPSLWARIKNIFGWV